MSVSSSPEFDYVLSFDDSFEHQPPPLKAYELENTNGNNVKEKKDESVDDEEENANVTQQDKLLLANDASTQKTQQFWECTHCGYHENLVSSTECIACFVPRKEAKNASTNTADEQLKSVKLQKQPTTKSIAKKQRIASTHNVQPTKPEHANDRNTKDKQSGYQFGDITKGAVKAVSNASDSALDAASNYKFGDITKGTFKAFGWK